MYCELSLSTPHRKSIVKIKGGAENIIYTTVPLFQNQPIMLMRNQNYFLNVFDTDNLFQFTTSFSHIMKNNDTYYYVFHIIKTTIDQNKRKEMREITDIPVLIESSEKTLQISRILDISRTGAKIECSQPIQGNEIMIHFQGVESIRKVPSVITWTSSVGGNYYYGVRF